MRTDTVGFINCNGCGDDFVIHYNQQDMLLWRSGKALVQVAMPYLSAMERELLISRNCGKCWDEMMAVLEQCDDED
jgi:hypothetical protein